MTVSKKQFEGRYAYIKPFGRVYRKVYCVAESPLDERTGLKNVLCEDMDSLYKGERFWVNQCNLFFDKKDLKTTYLPAFSKGDKVSNKNPVRDLFADSTLTVISIIRDGFEYCYLCEDTTKERRWVKESNVMK